MAYLASIHKASSVREAVKCNFLSNGELSLVVARANIADIYTFSGNALTLRTSFSVFGRINGIIPFRPMTAATDHLLIATDRYDYSTVSWDAEKGTIRNERQAEDVADRFLRDATCGPKYLSDPAGRMIAMHVYEGMLLLVPLLQQTEPKVGRKKVVDPDKIGNLEEHTPIRLQELKILDIAFLYGTKSPVIAILHRDGRSDCTQLVTYEVVKVGGVCELKEWDIKHDNLNELAATLIPVQDPIGGVLVLAETCVDYIPPTEKGTIITKALADTLEFGAWGFIDGQRILLSDKLNQLKVVLLEVDRKGAIAGIKVETIGKTSLASQLVYLDDGYVFVGSKSADSQLVKLSPTGPRCEVIQEFPNIAPVLDFQVLTSSHANPDDPLHDLYSSGQTRIVTASGGEFDGTLRSMKSGVGLEDSAILGDMEGIQGIWALKSNPSGDFDDTLVASFADETRIFAFDPEGEVEELDNFQGLSLDEETLAVSNLPGGRILQITTSKLKLIDLEGGTTVAEVTASAKISAASVNTQHILCNIGGKTLVVYKVDDYLTELTRRSFDNEIACLNAPESPSICAVGFWTTSAISLLKMPSLEDAAQELLGAGNESIAIPRSIIIAQVIDTKYPSLLVSMGDGTIYTFALDATTSSLSHKKTIALGTQAFYFQLIPRSPGLFSVFAASDHPSLIYGDNGRLMASSVTAEKVTHLHAFNAAAFPKSVVMIAAGELKISTIDTARQVHFKTLKFDQIVRRVAYSAARKLFAVLTIKLDLGLDSNEKLESYTSAVHLVDENSFSTIAEYGLDRGEIPESLICAKIDNGDGTKSEKFLVGTGYAGPEEECGEGRLLVFEVTEDRKLELTAQLQVHACVRRIQTMSDKIITAQNKSIVLYSFTYPTPLSPKLTRLTSYRSHSEPIDLSVSDPNILVGDLMKGPSLLNLTSDPAINKHTLAETARIYTTYWSTAVEIWDDETVVSADSEGNISLFQKSSSVLAEDQHRLMPIAEMHLGEIVNRIRRIPGVMTPETIVLPKAYFATGDGGVYLLGAIGKKHADLLMQLQSNMSRVIKGVGELEFAPWRAKRTATTSAEEPLRFVDGDFVERFLELGDDLQRSIVSGKKEVDSLKASVEEVRTLLEGLKRLH